MDQRKKQKEAAAKQRAAEADVNAYTRNVGIPLAIATELIANGQTMCRDRFGIVTPEEAFEPGVIFEQLSKRGILIHGKIESLVEVR